MSKANIAPTKMKMEAAITSKSVLMTGCFR